MRHQHRWTLTKIAQRLDLIQPLVYRRRAPLNEWRYQELPDPGPTMLTAPDIDDTRWERVAPGDFWTRWQANFVLRGRFTVPATWEVDRPAALYLPLAPAPAGEFCHPEALAYIDGAPYATCDRYHEEFSVPDKWRDGREHIIALHGYAGAQVQPGTRPCLGACAVVQIDQPLRDFVATARVALGVAQGLREIDPARGHLLNALDAAFSALDLNEPLNDAFYASVPAAHAALRARIARAGAPLDVDITAIGHAHLDVAWLWTLGQTRQKAARTFHTVQRLMEQFPEYKFTQSQPQLYDYTRRDRPALFEAIKQRVAEGRWEPIGGMWVEADCNLSGPESLARQFLLGRRFFREHFGAGAESPVLWLPDDFGYAWNLPQLLKQAGLEYFFTIKIGWSQYNRLPYDSFWWQGLDGTRVLTHFSTTRELGSPYAATYNAVVTPSEVMGTWENFQQKDLAGVEHTPPLLMAYGYGDGGGGPTREMLENLREFAAFPGAPRTHPGRVVDFFRDLEAKAGPQLPTWNGELYLELHRGTYTTQSRNKRANRESEFRLHDAEFLAALAALQAGAPYPREVLNQAWELVCLNQFHDILPGSSIHAVYEESQAQYKEVLAAAERVSTEALTALARVLGGDVLVVNPSSFPRRDLACLPGGLPAGAAGLARLDGQPVLIQTTAEGCWLDAGELPPYSVTPLVSAARADPPSRLSVSPTLLENELLRIELNAAGDIVRVYDRDAQREVLPPGALANQLLLYEDRPMQWDAWDVDVFHEDTVVPAGPADSITVLEAGPLRAALEVRRRLGNSACVQRLSLAHGSRRLDFETVIDWRERHTFLKAAFPVNVLAPAATYEIQWGHVQRPTHRNTSWDWARFETCAQKWADLSEGGYGVSVLNNGKYGHAIHENVLRLSLLRAPTYPDLEADQGEHRFTYSFLPHRDGPETVTVREAYALNNPLTAHAAHGGRPPALSASLIQVSAPTVVIETVKQAEDGDGLIVRLYENGRRRGLVTLTAGFPLAGAWETNLLEENQAGLDWTECSVTLSLRPFQIMTLRLRPAR